MNHAQQPNVKATPFFTNNNSGQVTGAGANVTASNTSGFVSAGAYKPAGSPTVFSGAAGTNVTPNSTVYADVSGNKNGFNAGVGFKTKW
jgi:hypothetical protein